MPDIFEQFNQASSKQKEQENAQALNSIPETQEDYQRQQDAAQEQKNQALKDKAGYDIPDNLSGDPEQQAANDNEQYSTLKLGGLSTKNTRDLYEDPDSWSPEYTMKDFVSESGNSIMRGIGNHILKGSGDMIQVAGGLAGFDIEKGTMLSNFLQESGNEMAANFKAAIPEELQGENITWSSALNPKFWSQNIAEMIPQLAEFIFLSKGGSSLAKKGAGALLKNSARAAKITEGGVVFGTGKGIIGKLATEQGLSSLGKTVFGAVGGGVTGNLASGLLNAAQVVNQNKELKDLNGNPVYSEEELSNMAASTMRNNMAWIGLDIASWGMTYGGGYKALGKLRNKGAGMFSKAQINTIGSKMFQYDVAPIAKAITRVGGKAGGEAIEEMFQESFEEWAAKKAQADQTGFFSESLGDIPSFWDFMTSKENKGTLVISAAMGALGGAAFNMKAHVDETADANYKLSNRIGNLSTVIDKKGTEAEESWNQFHKRKQIAEIVIEDKGLSVYEDFIGALVDNGSVSPEEVKVYDKMFEDFIELNKKAERLNVKGKNALLYNKFNETYVDSKIEEYENIAKQNIADYKQLSDQDEATKQILKEESKLKARIKALSIIKAEAVQNQENLILGKRAKPMDIQIKLDKFGNEMVVAGLSQDEFNNFTVEGDKLSATEKAKMKGRSKLNDLKDSADNIVKNGKSQLDDSGLVDRANNKIKEFKVSDLSSKAKALYDKAMNVFNGKKESNIQADEVDKEATSGNQGASGQTVVNGKKVQTPKTEAEATAEANQIMDDAIIDDKNETVEDSTYDAFKDNGASEDLLQHIAKKIYEEEKLTPREEEIRLANVDAVRTKIIKEILGTQDIKAAEEVQTEVDEEAAAEVDEETKSDQKIMTDEEAEAENSEDNEIDDDLNNEDLSEDEKRFVQSENDRKNEGKSIKDIKDDLVKKAKAKFKISKKNIKNSENEIGLDARKKKSANPIQKNIPAINIADFGFVTSFKQKARELIKGKVDVVSENELDRYLNRTTTYNLNTPSDIDKMATVNHQLKRMFPNAKEPTQAFVVRNLYESLGSIGLGHALASTIYIDSKAWQQDEVFMHELSHVFFKLSKEEPFVKDLIKKALLNKALVANTKKLYNDYTLYGLDDGQGGISEWTKGQIISFYKSVGVDPAKMESQIAKDVEAGVLKTIPLADQRYLVEEMFVKMLEGPLAASYDKTFNPKQEPQRQADTKKFWGLLRKKGEIIEQENAVEKMLKKLDENGDMPKGDLKDYIFNVFKATTQSINVDSFGMDARVSDQDQALQDEYNEIDKRKMESIDTEVPLFEQETAESQDDWSDAFQNALEEDGTPHFDTDFSSRVKTASRILKRFGSVYNTVLRKEHLRKTKNDRTNRRFSETFDRDTFEATVYNLALENDRSAAFIYNIENSQLKEISAFNNFLDKVHPKTKLQILNSMHYVMSNSKHINGVRNIVSVDPKTKQINYKMINSLSHNELKNSDNILAKMRSEFNAKSSEWTDFNESVAKIKLNKGTEQDFLNVLEMISNSTIQLDKIIAQGVMTYKGRVIPLETLISGFIKQNYLNNQFDPNKPIYVYNARPLVEAIVDTNRKFTPLSSVKNAEGNMEPVRITNNHLTKEIDDMTEFLAQNVTEDEFLERYSHMHHKQKERLGKAYVPNLFLKKIYDDYTKNGILPTVIQYHGLEDIDNKTGSLFKNSTETEQGLEDFIMFANTSTADNNRRLNSYMGNMGAFSDSPRKFMISMPRISFDEIFDMKGDKYSFKNDGRVLNSMFHTFSEMFDGDPVAKSKPKFKRNLTEEMKSTTKFLNENGEALSKIKKLSKYFTNGRLNMEGRKLAAEYTISSVANGFNISESFLPGIKAFNNRSDLSKRMKMNSSPVLSVKNPNFKLEPLFFSDEIVNGGVSGTDSGMYILEEDAKRLQNLGKGVFDMNNGFKLLNASIEKRNTNFKGRAAYLKGYTTIIDQNHPLYGAMKSRKDKYNAYHKKKYGVDPSMDLSDGSFNHMVIAIPQSSDKSNFYPEKFTQRNAEGELEYTEKGAMLSPENISQNLEQLNKDQDKFYYNKKGDFVGIETYNFGPQQLMDKQVSTSNTPVQFINSVMVNAAINGRLDLAIEIQNLIADQKQEILSQALEEFKTKSPQDYKEFIGKHLNREDMDQAQRILFEDNGSIFHPYLNTIINNQLAKTLRRLGNKMKTPGTYAHQKPDLNVNSDLLSVGSRLKGYGTSGIGGITTAEAILPKHMEGTVKPRKEYTIYTHENELFAIHKARGKNINTRATLDEELEQLKKIANARAKDASKRNTGTTANYEQFLGEVKKKGVTVGYYVKGDTVIMSRVPGHGPSSTGIFEAVGFDKGDGNQVMVPSEFNDIIGADNDGDALFIQTKGGKGYDKWNKAFEKIVDYWSSPEMKDQVTTKMDFKDDVDQIVENIQKQYGTQEDYIMPFSPIQRMADYNNTMVSKRNVGPIFNTHKIANLLAAYEVGIGSRIQIGKKFYENFKDEAVGQESRNQKSAILANIILDNAKYGYADILGLNENNVNQAAILVNLGVSIEDVGRILNSPAAKLWSKYNRNNNSLFHDSRKQETIIEKIYDDLKIKRNKNVSMNINPLKAHENSEAGAIIETLNYLNKMNSEIQNVSAIMSGHKKIHVNPLVLQKQIQDFHDLMDNKKETNLLKFTQEFKDNPDLRNYLNTAESTLEHIKETNPVYRKSTNSVVQNINEALGGNLSVRNIEAISEDINLFITSRLLGHNNIDDDFAKQLMDPKSENSVFKSLEQYAKLLRKNIVIDKDNVLNSVSAFDNSLLLNKAMSLSFSGNDIYVVANTAFVNESFNEDERHRAQEEFEELPEDLKNKLIIYDLIENGWKGKRSIAPFFDANTNAMINMASDFDMQDKDQEISKPVLEKLEKAVILRAASSSNNPLPKVYMKGNRSADTFLEAQKAIFTDNNILSAVGRGEPVYVNVKSKGKNLVYFIPRPTADKIGEAKLEIGKKAQTKKLINLAAADLELITQKEFMNTNMNLALIKDSNVSVEYRPGAGYNIPGANLDPLVEATIEYEEMSRKMQEHFKNGNPAEGFKGMDAREDYYEDVFTQEKPMDFFEFEKAKEFNPAISKNIRKDEYNKYVALKNEANKIAKEIVPQFEAMSTEDLLENYAKYGEKDVYAYASVMTPLVKQIANNLASSQAELFKQNETEANVREGGDVSKMQAYLMTGSTIPSNHPSAQAMARILETEYKKFTSEKRKYMSEMNKVTDALYKEKLGYGDSRSFRNIVMRIRDFIFKGPTDVYQRLYGNLVERNEVLDENKKMTYSFKLKSQSEINSLFEKGDITQAEKDFYDHFKKVTAELKPKNLKKTEEDYIPHTSMSRLEAFSSRGLLGLMVNSREPDQAIYAVKMFMPNQDGDKTLVSFKTIEDNFKSDSRNVHKKNNINSILEYRKAKNKAKSLLKDGKNEDGSKIAYSNVETNTALGFGAINRFANNRSIKATEMPSMDLNKALSDYIHSSLFVNGNSKFKGMEKLQGYIDGVLAYNNEKGNSNLNIHVQKVWKDYFLRNKRQTSVLGETGDKVINTLTRMNLFYSLGYQANKNTGGLYAVGNILVGKYQNIKNVGGKKWIKGELAFWGLDKGFQGGIPQVIKRHKRISKIMKNINFMEINVYDEVNMEKKQGLDAVISDLALSPMIYSERWIQQVHMLGHLTEEELDRFDDEGDYKEGTLQIPNERLVEIEDIVKSSHGRGYQPTDQRAMQMYSWGNMMLQFSKFLPTMVNDRFAKKDVNIYGKNSIGTLRAVGHMVRHVMNDPKGFVEYRNSLSKEERSRLDDGMRGVALSTVIGLGGAALASDTANELFWDSNYYFNHPKLISKLIPAPIKTINNLSGGFF